MFNFLRLWKQCNVISFLSQIELPAHHKRVDLCESCLCETLIRLYQTYQIKPKFIDIANIKNNKVNHSASQLVTQTHSCILN